MSDLIDMKVRPCRRCWLGDANNGPVPYAGPDSPELVVIGEAPGPDEDEQGEPFVGRSGQYLRRYLKDTQIRPAITGFMNVVSCLPPGGDKPFRQPKSQEVDACRVNLLFQLRVLKPPLVLLAGKFALNAFRPKWKISKERGRPLCLNVGMGPFVAVPTFHPSAILRAPPLRRDLEKDLKQVKWRMREGNLWERWPETCRLCGGPVDAYAHDGAAYCKRHRSWADEDWAEFEGAQPATHAQAVML